MKQDVKICVDARVNFFSQYCAVPAGLEAAVEQFISDTNALGERCADAAEFELQFASQGLSDQFNSLVPQCVPQPQTAAAPVPVNLEPEEEDSVGREAADRAAFYAGAAMDLAKTRAMAKLGILDDVTRISNAAELVSGVADLFGKGKKK